MRKVKHILAELEARRKARCSTCEELHVNCNCVVHSCGAKVSFEKAMLDNGCPACKEA